MKGLTTLLVLTILTGCTAYADAPGREDATRQIKQKMAADPYITRIKNCGHVGDTWRFEVYAMYPAADGESLLGWYDVNVKTGEIRDVLAQADPFQPWRDYSATLGN